MKRKYIVISLDDEEFIITFDDHPKLHHDKVAESIRGTKVYQGAGVYHRDFRRSDTVAAGFIDRDGNCFGKSETLGIRSRGEIDTKLLKR